MLTAKRLLQKLYIRLSYFLRCQITEDMSLVEAKGILHDFYPQRPPIFNQKVNYNPKYDLMIIVPVFNTEDYLKDCIDSLLKQDTTYSYKIVFVDDGSTDHSNIILDDYIENEKVEIIHKQNSGIAGARNTALKNICGRYIMFVDSDDLLAADAVELLMSVALSKKADIVEGAYIEFTGTQPIDYEKKNEQASGYPWGKVIRSDKMINLCFPEGYQYEDTIISTLLMPGCNTVCSIPYTIYYYRKNDKSITEMLNSKKESVDTFYITMYCFREAMKRGYKISVEDFLRQVRLNWLRTQTLPLEIKKAIFICEIDILSRFFDEGIAHVNGTMKKLEKVLKKHNYIAYEWLMDNWQVFDVLR